MLIILVANLTLAAAMFGVIWVIQLVHYPMLQGLSADAFTRWHKFHSARITFIVGPLMVGELGLSLWLAWSRDDGEAIFALALTIGIWASTFLLSVPLHNRLGKSKTERGEIDVTLQRLVATNWPRTLMYSIKVSVSIVMFLEFVSQ